MAPSALVYLSPYILSLVISLGLAFFIAFRRRQPGAFALSIVIRLAVLDMIGFILELASHSLTAKIGWDNFQYLCLIWMAPAILIFTLIYTGRRFQRPGLVHSAITAAPLAASALILTSAFQGVLHPTARLIPGGLGSLLIYDFGIQDYVVVGYIYVYILISLFLLQRHGRNQNRAAQMQTWIIGIGLIIPALGGALTMLGVEINRQRDFTPLTYALSDLTLAWGLFRHALLKITPVAREIVFERITDPVIVLDLEDRVIDLNPAAQRLVALEPSRAVGRPVSTLLEGVCIQHDSDPLVEWRFESTLPVLDEERHFEVHIVPLFDQGGRLSGRLVLFHDITERMANEALLLKQQDRLERRVQERTADLEAVNRFSIDLANLPAEVDLDEFLAEQFKQQTGAFVVVLSEYDPPTRQIVTRHITVDNVLLARINQIAGKNLLGMAMPLPDGQYEALTKDVIADRQNLAAATLGAIPSVAAGVLERLFEIDHVTILGIAHQGILMGTAALMIQKGRGMPSERQLRAFSPIAAIALRKRKADLALGRYADRMKILHHIDHSILTALSPETIAAAALNGIGQLIPLYQSAVFLVDPTTGRIHALASAGEEQDRCPWLTDRKVSGVLDALQQEDRWLIEDTHQSPHTRAICRTCALESGHALLLVRLRCQGKRVGTLHLCSSEKQAFTGENLEIAQEIADQLAIVIHQADLLEKVQVTARELSEAYDAIIAGWSRALELRDKETKGHSDRVTRLAMQLAGEMGMSEEERVHFRRGVFLHDIGKMGIPDSILLKPGPLTPDEWVIMRKHPEYGYQLLSEIAYLRPALDVAFCHHEKWDGSGYPRGLKGEEIPLSARIFSVVDVWDALTSDRPYRPAWSEKEAAAYLRQKAGSEFDPRVVDTFLKLVSKFNGG